MIVHLPGEESLTKECFFAWLKTTPKFGGPKVLGEFLPHRR